MAKHKGYPGRKEGFGQPQGKPADREKPWRKPPAVKEIKKEDNRVSTFMKERDISLTQAIEMMGNYFGGPDGEKLEEEVLLNLDF